VFGVTSEGAGNSTVSGRVSEELDETVIITASDEVSILGSADTVDVSTISTAGEDTLNIPAELGSLGGPNGTSGVGSTRSILAHTIELEEEKFVSTTVGANVRTISSPIEVGNV